MIVTARQVAVYAFARPVDMRQWFGTLTALVKVLEDQLAEQQVLVA